jgi:hypothetical protein
MLIIAEKLKTKSFKNIQSAFLFAAQLRQVIGTKLNHNENVEKLRESIAKNIMRPNGLSTQNPVRAKLVKRPEDYCIRVTLCLFLHKS